MKITLWLLVSLILISTAAALVNIELQCSQPDCRYNPGETVDIDVVLSASPSTTLRAFKIIILNNDAGRFNFVSGADQNDAFFIKNFITNKPDSSVQWVMNDAKNAGNSLSARTVIGSIKGKAVADGTVQLTIAEDGNQQDSQGTFFQESSGKFPVFHSFSSAPLTVTVFSGCSTDNDCSGSTPRCIEATGACVQCEKATEQADCSPGKICHQDNQCGAPFAISSTAIVNGVFVDEKYGCYQNGVADAGAGAGVSPQLGISGIPTGTNSLVLLIDDPDAPADPGPSPFTHWLLWDIPSTSTTTSITEDTVPDGTTLQGTNDFGTIGYGGFCPPDSDQPHTYRLRVYATNSLTLNLAGGSSKQDLLTALGVTDSQTTFTSTNILGMATLSGTYPSCGDALVQGIEDCDDGDEDNGDSCKNDCTPNVCGDNIRNTGVEQCDDGNTDDTDGCKNDCTLNNCGNSQIDPGENCVTCSTDAGCPDGLVCDDGTQSCVVSCALGLTDCSGSCVDLQTDSGNCGGCGGVCSPGDNCVGGNCQTPASGDTDGDGVKDLSEHTNCQNTPTGYKDNVYTTGSLAGCIIGDVDINEKIDSDDIATFVAEYNGRSDGFADAVDLNQDNSLTSDDIAVFIDKYNKRP